MVTAAVPLALASPSTTVRQAVADRPSDYGKQRPACSDKMAIEVGAVSQSVYYFMHIQYMDHFTEQAGLTAVPLVPGTSSMAVIPLLSAKFLWLFPISSQPM